MSKSLGWIVSAILAVCLVGVGWWAWSQRPDSSASEPSWLFSLGAQSGTMTDNGDGTYALLLQGADSEVVAFTDRPVRDAGLVDAQALITEWPTLFGTSPPNAVLVEHRAAGDPSSLVLTLDNARVQGSDVAFTAKVLEGAVPDRLAPLADRPYPSTPTSFAGVTLFVDGTQLSPIEAGILKDVGYQETSPPGP